MHHYYITDTCCLNVGSSTIVASRSGTLRVHNALLISVLTGLVHVKTEHCRVNLVMAKDEQEAKDGLCKDVQNTIEDGLGIGVDNVAALAQAPGDRVQEPQEQGQHTAVHEGALDRTSQGGGMATSVNSKLVSDEEQGRRAKGEVSPLVARLGEGTD